MFVKILYIDFNNNFIYLLQNNKINALGNFGKSEEEKQFIYDLHKQYIIMLNRPKRQGNVGEDFLQSYMFDYRECDYCNEICQINGSVIHSKNCALKKTLYVIIFFVCNFIFFAFFIK